MFTLRMNRVNLQCIPYFIASCYNDLFQEAHEPLVVIGSVASYNVGISNKNADIRRD